MHTGTQSYAGWTKRPRTIARCGSRQCTHGAQQTPQGLPYLCSSGSGPCATSVTSTAYCCAFTATLRPRSSMVLMVLRKRTDGLASSFSVAAPCGVISRT